MVAELILSLDRIRNILYQTHFVYVRKKRVTDGINCKSKVKMDNMTDESEDLIESSAMATNPAYLSDFELTNANLG